MSLNSGIPSQTGRADAVVSSLTQDEVEGTLPAMVFPQEAEEEALRPLLARALLLEEAVRAPHHQLQLISVYRFLQLLGTFLLLLGLSWPLPLLGTSLPHPGLSCPVRH